MPRNRIYVYQGNWKPDLKNVRWESPGDLLVTSFDHFDPESILNVYMDDESRLEGGRSFLPPINVFPSKGQLYLPDNGVVHMARAFLADREGAGIVPIRVFEIRGDVRDYGKLVDQHEGLKSAQLGTVADLFRAPVLRKTKWANKLKRQS